MFQIDAMSREPVYEQIIHQVEQFILTDVLQPEAQIPSVRSVSMTNSINPRTILKAYTELDARGLIQSVPGKGYYVCADAQQKLLEKGREKMKDLTEMLMALAMAGVTKEEITACVEQAFTEAKELQKGGSQASSRSRISQNGFRISPHWKMSPVPSAPAVFTVWSALMVPENPRSCGRSPVCISRTAVKSASTANRSGIILL